MSEAQVCDLASTTVMSVSFNTRTLTALLLWSLHRVLDATDVSVLMVDNASTDGTTELLRNAEQAGLCTVLTNPTNEGHGLALGRAMADTAARLAVPALSGSGDPRALQITALYPGDVDGVIEHLATAPPLGPHLAIVFLDREEANAEGLEALGYTRVDVSPLMTRALEPSTPKSTELHIGVASEADRTDLAALDERSAVYRFDGGGINVVVARQETSLVGKVQMVEAVAGIGYLTDMVVNEHHRRGGIGTVLVADLESRARANGCDWMVLVSTDEGRPLYRACGYSVAAWIHSYAKV